MGEVAPAQRLGGVERRMVAESDEGVLERGARPRVRVDVARRHDGQAQPLGEAREAAVARPVVAVEGALELDVEALAPEGRAQPLEPGLVVDAVARAATQADEAGGVPLARPPRHLWRRLARIAVMDVRRGDDPAQVAPAHRVLDQQRDVAAVLERHLRPVDRAQPEARGGLRELHRAAQAVVVRERERVVAELGRGGRQLVRERGPVEEGEGGVGMELDVMAVGTAVAGGPPRRSRRARQRTGLLPWVLASKRALGKGCMRWTGGSQRSAMRRIRVQGNLWRWLRFFSDLCQCRVTWSWKAIIASALPGTA